MSSTAYSYLRFSTPEQERGDSFRRQKEMAERYASLHGLELDDRSFQDLGVSAFRGANAETGRLGEFLEAVRSGAIERDCYLLVESLDRLSRNKPHKALRLLEAICEQGVTVVTLSDGRSYNEESLDGDGGMNLLFALMTGIRAHEESATKSRRLKEAWGAKRAHARERPLTARCPAWLSLKADRSGFDVTKARAAVVRRIYKEAMRGLGQHRIAEGLNQDRVPVFGRGRYWQRSYIKKILESPAVIGTYVPHQNDHVSGKRVRRPSEPVEGYYPAVVDRETYSRVRAMQGKAAKAPTTRGQRPVSHMLAGLARCAACGAAMTRVNKGTRGGYPYLVCAQAKAGGGCQYRGIRVEALEETVARNAVALYGSMPEGTQGLDAMYCDLEDKRDAAAAEITLWLERLKLGPSRAVQAALARAEANKDSIDRAMRAVSERMMAVGLVAQHAAMNDLVDALEDRHAGDATHVNALLRQVFSKAVLDWREGAVHFEWRQGGSTKLALGDTAH